MTIMDSSRKYKHVPTLHAINKQLLAPVKDLENRFLCLGFIEVLNGRCMESAQHFALYKTGMMKTTYDALDKTVLSDEDFAYLQQLWRNADAEARNVFLEAIRETHHDNLNYYAQLKGYHVEDIEYAIKTEVKTEELEDAASSNTTNGDRNDSQIVVYDPKQHHILESIRELTGLQEMYDKPHADERESNNEPDANTSGPDWPCLKSVGNNHEIVDKKPSLPPFKFAAGVETTDDSHEHQAFGSAPQTKTQWVTENRNDFAFSFSFSEQGSGIPFGPSKVAKSPLPGRKSPLNSFNAFKNGRLVNNTSIPQSVKSEPGEILFGRRSPRSSPSPVPSENIQIKDGLKEDGLGKDDHSPIPDGANSGFKLGQDTSTQRSAEYTPIPLATMKDRSMIVPKMPSMKQGGRVNSRHQESLSLAPSTPKPTTLDQFSAQDESPIAPAISPINREPSRPGYTPRNGTRPPRKPRAIAERIRDILRQPIDYSNEGYIYVLKAPRFFEEFPPSRNCAEPEQWIKIGITRNIEERMDSLRRQCGFTDIVECDDILERPIPMPELRRVERLCHEELANFQRPLDCSETGARCATTHQEWFNVTEEVAIRTVNRWLRFILQEQYTDRGHLKSGFWETRVDLGEYLMTSKDEDLDRTHERYQSWLETSIRREKQSGYY